MTTRAARREAQRHSLDARAGGRLEGAPGRRHAPLARKVLMIALADLLPSRLQLGGLLGIFFAGSVFWLCGRALARGRGTPELQLFAGWGAFCLVLACWGVATQA